MRSLDHGSAGLRMTGGRFGGFEGMKGTCAAVRGCERGDAVRTGCAGRGVKKRGAYLSDLQS